jgi:hypothetical protein
VKQIVIIRYLLGYFVLLGFVVDGIAAGNDGPPCLLELCIGSAPMLEHVAEKRLRLPAAKQRTESGIDYRCFEATRRSYLKLGVLRPDDVVVSIGLSTFEDCGGNSTAIHKSIPRTVTREGLRFGDSRQNVLRVYGSPETVVKDKSTFDRWLSDRKLPPDYYQNHPLTQLFVYGPPERQGEFRVIGFDQRDRVILLRIYAGP